jgi:hypothetical protein
LVCLIECSKKYHRFIQDAESKKPIPSASIFLNTTSIGTISNSAGAFQLQIPEGNFELIISSIGYETKAIASLLLSGEHLSI